LVNKDNKIKTIIDYVNESVFDELEDSYADRENGTIYNHHENINTVRKMINSFGNKDYNTSYGYYGDDCEFRDGTDAGDVTYTLTQQKDLDKKFLASFDLNGIDQVGYPDYLHYEMGDAKVVLSWWNFRLTRKSDKKNIVAPIFYIHYFDDKGKIVAETSYYSQKLLEAK
jgi:hypothetical protein